MSNKRNRKKRALQQEVSMLRAAVNGVPRRWLAYEVERIRSYDLSCGKRLGVHKATRMVKERKRKEAAEMCASIKALTSDMSDMRFFGAPSDKHLDGYGFTRGSCRRRHAGPQTL